jgi:hypothetical protein
VDDVSSNQAPRSLNNARILLSYEAYIVVHVADGTVTVAVTLTEEGAAGVMYALELDMTEDVARLDVILELTPLVLLSRLVANC